ncbi:unnamed protein product, partial [Lymnaea stagnalis]
QDKRQLSSWGLPHPVLEAYKNQGVTTMFEWQAECLLTAQVLEGGNLVYSAPTSAGKTLVAELLVLKRVVETRKKALIILPFVSVAREKMYSLQRLYQDAGIRVGGYMGSYSPAGGLSSVDVAVCTIQRCCFQIPCSTISFTLPGAVVVDELHMVGDSHRGYLLELMLTKLAYITHRATNGNAESKVQIIGMSATLPNLHLLATWLKASLYHTDYRPVPLTEYLKIDNKILDGQLLVQREIPALLTFPDDQDHVTALCLETVSAGHAALIFCPTKIWCENLCESVARRFYAIISENTKAELQERKDDGAPIVASGILITLDREGLMETVEQLGRCPVGADPMLARCVLNGVAYHHAGLTFDERDIIEGAFRQGHLKVLIATSTLSSGVNLPARRVIIRTPIFHGKLIDTLTYKQMAGRAGRKGVDTQGESILICKAQEKAKAKNLLKSELPAVESCLQFNVKEGLSSSLKRAVLEIVVSGVAPKVEDVVTYIDCTLLSVSLEGNGLGQVKTALVESCIKYLQENEFVTVQVSQKEETNKFYPTQLGAAILASSLSPDEGLLVFAELQKARRAFALDTELHTIYLVTPVYTSDVSSSIDWFHYHNLWENLTPADRRVAELVGVSESFIGKALSGRLGKTESAKKALGIHQRFYTALVLNYLVQETPIMEVAAKFNCNKGQLQSLQQSASTYAGMVTVFCGRLGWHNLELLLSQFQKRLSCGVQQELVDLVRIEALNASSARMLYNAGYHTVADVARADAVDVENLFKKAAPFQSEKKQDGETDWELKERRRARCIWLTGRKGVTEMDAALVIIEEAKVIIQGELGVNRISWGTGEDNADKIFSESLFDSSEKLSPWEQKVNQVGKQAAFMDSTPKGILGNEHLVNIPLVRDDSDVENEAQKSGVSCHELDDTINAVSSDSEDGESLIAASNYERLIHLDDGAIDERNSGSLSPDVSYALGEEDLMAALQMSDSFNVSPVITQIPQNLQCKVPQNSTPKIPLGTRSVNLRIGTLDRNSNKAEITPINKQKNAQVGHNELETNMKGTGISDSGGTMEPSSNNSSRNDGSDCVPPTPPNEATSLVSPFKFSFYSPLRPKVPKTLEHSEAKPGRTEPFTIIKEKNKKICTENQSIMESLNRLEQPTWINNRLEQPTRHNQAMASQLLSQQSFTIIDVCANRILFETFLKEWKLQPSYSLSLACEKKPPESVRRSSTGIGGKFLKKGNSHVSGIPIPDTCSILIGLSVSWENRDSYYISLMPTGITAEVDPNDTLAEPPLDDSLSQKHRIQSVFQVLDSNLASKQTVAIYDAKMAYNYLAKALGIALAHCEDPRVADWLREPTARLKNLHRMVAAHCPEELPLLDAVGGVSGYHGMGTDIKSKISGRLRASTESVLTMKLISKYHTMLVEEHLLDALLDVEMPSLITLARMELNGFGVSEAEFESQKTVMTTKLTVLEEQAYKMAGHVFSLTSTDDVAKILYIELKLPINGDPTVVPHLPTRGTRGRRTTIGSTSKEVLEKLQKFHPLPAVILEWRRISSALTKSLFALQNAARLCPKLDMSRVFSECQIFTATGRVSMAEPNLQNVPKDFSIQLPGIENNRQEAKIIDPDNLVTAPISMRKLFIPFKGGVILAADYSQLELRIICHLSGDVKLANILNATDGDVFNMIAAQMKGIPLEEVTSDHRQQAKQVCYGMLYGIGPKALGEQLGVDENDAGVFMETFKSRYQGIRKYLRETVEFCQKNGYVKTIFNRRRYLPSIRNSNPNARAQAERQAVNTTIQGSAADLVKIAMSNIDRKLMQLFPMTRNCHSQVSRGKKISTVRGAFLVLQLHDELIYEVSANQVAEVARLVKNEMEVAVKLNVCMPVKVKVGPSWGQLCEYNVQ